MTDTSLSLLDRLSGSSDSQSWQRLVDLYTPLLRAWLARWEVRGADADDLVQEVLLTVVRELPDFRHNRRQGAFRSWLRQILANRLQHHWRMRNNRPAATGGSSFAEQIDQLASGSSELSRAWDEEHDRHVIVRLLAQCQSRFEPATWQAFQRLMIDGADARSVAAELDISPNAVYIAKSRVLAVLRQEAAGLVE
jgi:RNA polymerase sigma-70 factor (ECF subfamily)